MYTRQLTTIHTKHLKIQHVEKVKDDDEEEEEAEEEEEEDGHMVGRNM